MRRKLIVANLVCLLGLTALVFGGPVVSGAVLLMIPTPLPDAHRELPASYVPRHKGYISLSTGVYVRENEDIVVHSTPPLILRRTYISGYRVSKQFGIGTTHSGEIWLSGDGARFQWVQLIQATGSRISFRRTSFGTSHLNAMFLHESSLPEWNGAMIGWTGLTWVLRLPNDGVRYFLPCGHGLKAPCAIIQEQDADGHTINYVRDGAGRLLKMAAENGWIAFDYDDRERITRAYASSGAEVVYVYDDRGRLTRANAGQDVYRYSYNNRDELETMTEPGKVTINRFDRNGRVTHQVTTFDGDPIMYTFAYTYRVEGDRVAQVDSDDYDGSSSRYEYNADQEIVGETQRSGGYEYRFTYTRDPRTNAVTSLTLSCPDRTGRVSKHFSFVRGDSEEWIKYDLMQTRCSWKKRQLGPQEADRRFTGGV